MNPLRRAVLVVLALLAVLVATAGPAGAATPETLEPTDNISTGQAILLFVVLPLAIDAVIALAVLAPGWTRGGRGDSPDSVRVDPLTLDAGAAGGGRGAEPAALEPASDGGTGGTSAQW
jgi:hypothetical protein